MHDYNGGGGGLGRRVITVEEIFKKKKNTPKFANLLDFRIFVYISRNRG